MAFRIAQDRLTEDIIVALGSGLFLILFAPFLLRMLGLEVRTKGEPVANDELQRLEAVVQRLEKQYDKLLL
jgi:hypothetical protein